MTRPLFLKHLSAPRPGLAGLVFALAAAAALAFTVADGVFTLRAWPLIAGVVFGVALQRGELSLVRAWRDFLLLKDSSQLLGFLAALFVAETLTLGVLALTGATAAPANARIGPVSWMLPIAAFLFGVGCVIARGGVMVNLRRLAEGSLVATPALFAIFIGFMSAIAMWPWTYRVAVEAAPHPWLPERLGYAGTLSVQLVALGLLAIPLWRRRPPHVVDPRGFAVRLFVEPWPATTAGALLGLLVAASYAAGEPLGLIAECATVARWLATAAGLIPAHLPALSEGVGGLLVPELHGFALNEPVVILAGFLVGAFACALASGRFTITGFSFVECVEMTVGGLLVGWGAMNALGAITGEAIAGVAVGAGSGWVFLGFASLGVVVALKLDPRPEVTLSPADLPPSPG